MAGTSTHIIYGYREIAYPHRWKIGVKCWSNAKGRDQLHRKGKSGCPYFDNYVNARFREGKRFEEFMGYFELETFNGTHREAEKREENYTDLFNAMHPNGFNLQKGGYNGTFSEISRKRMAESQKNRPPCSQETREKLRKSSSGSGNAMYGKPVSQETRDKIRKANTGKKRSEESKRKMGHKGENHPFFGKNLTKEHKDKIGLRQKGKKNQSVAVFETTWMY